MQTLIILYGYSFILTIQGILTRFCGESLANAPDLSRSGQQKSLYIFFTQRKCQSFNCSFCCVFVSEHFPHLFISTNWIADCVRNYGDFFRNVLNKSPQPITFLFQKKDRKALKDSCQNISNSAANQGSQSEYLLACLFLKLLKN